MTLPTSGAISLSHFSTEMKQASTFSASLSWIKANTKAGQESNSISGYYGKTWYQKNNGGAADTRPWLQSDCNCACACACDCNYNCTCFLEGSLVLMADGSSRPIETVRIGDKVQGGGGYINTVLALDRPRLGPRPMYRINGEHETTNEHAHFGPGGIYAIDPKAFAAERQHPQEVILEDGRRALWDVPYLNPDLVTMLAVGTVLSTVAEDKAVWSLERFNLPPSTQLFHLVLDGSRTYFVNGYLVSGWAGGPFDYSTWSHKC